MSTRLYKINGEYNTFEYWHDHYGYTRTPTFSVQYKTTNPWGAAFASGGYYDAEDLMDIFTFSFFVPGVVGWNGIDDLALVGYYPAAATDLTVARDSEVSNAATLTQDNETYYLVQNDIEYGWMSQAEFEARGWSTDVGDPPSYIVFDTTTGTIVHSIVDEGLVYGEVGYVLMDDAGSMITVYETGVHVESFYFTTNGRNETQNTDISHADIPVYNEDGTSPAADTPYDGSPVLAFMDVTGNTKQSDGESLYVDNGELRLDAPDTDEGEQWAALVEYIEPAPPTPFIELDLGLWYRNNAWEKYKPPASDTAYSGLLSQEDVDAVTAFGLTITTDSTGAGPIGGIVANSPSNNNRYRFEYELLALYSDIVNNHGSGSLTFDQTNFTVVRNIEANRALGLILLKNQYAYQTLVSAWRLRVTKYDAQYIDVLLGLRWDSTQWRTVDFNYSLSGNYWYGGIMSAEDQQRLIDFGCTIRDQGSSEVGTYGEIAYQNRYFAYEVIGIYSDVNGTTSAQYDLSTLYLQIYNSRFTIWCSVQNSSSAITWKCRIYKLT